MRPTLIDKQLPMQRPVLVTTIGWFLVLSAMMIVITNSLLFNNPRANLALSDRIIPPDIRFVIFNLMSAMAIICGAGLLFRQRWSRWMYVGMGVLTALLTLLIGPIAVAFLPVLFVFVGTSIYLFDPRVTPYFAAPPPPCEVERPLRSFKQQIAGKPCGSCGDQLLMASDGFECPNCSTIFCRRCETPELCRRCRRELTKADELAR